MRVSLHLSMHRGVPNVFTVLVENDNVEYSALCVMTLFYFLNSIKWVVISVMAIPCCGDANSNTESTPKHLVLH